MQSVIDYTGVFMGLGVCLSIIGLLITLCTLAAIERTQRPHYMVLLITGLILLLMGSVHIFTSAIVAGAL